MKGIEFVLSPGCATLHTVYMLQYECMLSPHYSTSTRQASDMPQEMVQEAVEIVTMSVDKFINVKNYEVMRNWDGALQLEVTVTDARCFTNDAHLTLLLRVVLKRLHFHPQTNTDALM